MTHGWISNTWEGPGTSQALSKYRFPGWSHFILTQCWRPVGWVSEFLVTDVEPKTQRGQVALFKVMQNTATALGSLPCKTCELSIIFGYRAVLLGF